MLAGPRPTGQGTNGVSAQGAVSGGRSLGGIPARRVKPYGPRDPERLAKMRDLYERGYSLDKIGALLRVSRQSVFEAFRRHGLQTRPHPEPVIQEFRGQRFSLRPDGHFRRTTGDRALMSRVVWEAHRGPIPPGHDIAHRNRDPRDNRIENLDCLPRAESSRYSHRKNGYTKGTIPLKYPRTALCAWCGKSFVIATTFERGKKNCSGACRSANQRVISMLRGVRRREDAGATVAMGATA